MIGMETSAVDSVNETEHIESKHIHWADAMVQKFTGVNSSWYTELSLGFNPYPANVENTVSF